MATNRTTAYINYLLSENCYLQSQCDELSEMLQTTQSNVSSLNTFIQTAYDISENCVHVVTYDSCGNELACLNSDGAGGFIPCMRDFSDNILPCVLPPRTLGTRSIDKKNQKKRGIYDYPPYYYPYYPYYASYYNPYYASYYNPYYAPYYNPYLSKYPYTSEYSSKSSE